MTWLSYALLSAAAAALTAILVKIGMEGVAPTLATAIRTLVVAAFAWGMAAALGELRGAGSISGRSVLFLLLSGVSTGVSWIAYFRALQAGSVTHVTAVDKLSLPLTIVLAVLWLGEPLGWRTGLGIALMTAGALLTISQS